MRRSLEFRRRRLALLVGCACLAIGATPRGFAQQAPAPAEPAPDPAGAAPAAAPEPTAGRGLSLGGWRIPPVRTSGSVGYDLRMGRGPGEFSSTEHLVTGTINAASYLYQPWFALVSGSLGLTVSRSKLSGDDAAGFGQDGSNDRFTTGNVRLDVFPRSRFPFEVHYEVNDSRIDSGAPGTFDYRSRVFGLSQKYRPLDGRYNVNASAERRTFDTVAGQDTLDTLLANFDTHWKANEASLGASYSRGQRESTDERSMFRTLVGRHHYAPGSELAIDSTLNWSNTDDQLLTFRNDLSLLQWSTVGVWNPEGRPWTISGGLRAFAVEDDVSGLSSQSYGATLGATYEVSKNLRLTTSGSVNAVHTNDVTSTATLGSLGASYQGDSIDLRGFRYDWFGGTSLSLSHSEEQQERTIAGQLGHTLTRTWDLSEQSALGLNLGQSANASHSQQEPEVDLPGLPDTTRLLVHSAALSWSNSGIERNGYARVSFSDSREIGGARSRFQLLNLQLSGTLQFDRHQSLNGDATLQWSRQRSGDSFDTLRGSVVPGLPTSNQSVGGEISYRHTRLFDVPRLRFTSRLRMAQDVQDQPGALALIPDRETRLWENRLDWNVGRLETQLVLRMSWVDGQRRDLLMWRVQRSFGQ